jgi:hypothetical protein
MKHALRNRIQPMEARYFTDHREPELMTTFVKVRLRPRRANIDFMGVCVPHPCQAVCLSLQCSSSVQGARMYWGLWQKSLFFNQKRNLPPLANGKPQSRELIFRKCLS